MCDFCLLKLSLAGHGRRWVDWWLAVKLWCFPNLQAHTSMTSSALQAFTLNVVNSSCAAQAMRLISQYRLPHSYFTPGAPPHTSYPLCTLKDSQPLVFFLVRSLAEGWHKLDWMALLWKQGGCSIIYYYLYYC